jgi:signal transduction histidine kinase
MFLAKADKRMTPITLEWVDLLHELEAIRELYEASAAEHGVTLTGTWRGSVMVKLDRTLFQRAVCNLVENALKNTAKHGTVILRALSENGTIFVEVADTGRGIPVEDLPYVFEPFYRADRARSAGSGGAGLGLAIVKSIADLHGGNVHLQSTLGRGTTVRVTFPANRAVAENTSSLTKS